MDWRDVDLLAARPVGEREVWAGYDPQESEDGDNAALVIALPPDEPAGKFRLIERHQLRGADFQAQAEFIVKVLARYRCTCLGIDANGVGAAVGSCCATVCAVSSESTIRSRPGPRW